MILEFTGKSYWFVASSLVNLGKFVIKKALLKLKNEHKKIVAIGRNVNVLRPLC